MIDLERGNGSGLGVVVGVGDLAIAREQQGQLITYALGSCIGLTAFDPVARIGGLLHYMLPQPAEQTEPAALKPCMYASTGIPLLFRRLADAGARKDRLVLCAAGGAEIINDSAVFAIGKRNRTILRKIFWKDGTVLSGEDTGGSLARTLLLDLGSGRVRVRTKERESVLWSPGMKNPPVHRGVIT